MHWSSIPIHIIDFEGTKTSGILEYGIVTLHNNQITQTLSQLCLPTGPINSQDFHLHRISQIDTQNTLPFSHNWPLFSSLRSTGPLTAHHAQTENTLLKHTWPYTKNSPDFLNPKLTSTSWGPWIDTCQLFKTLFPQLISYKLIHLINTFHLTDKLTKLTKKHCLPTRCQPHCALYDALASTLLLQYIANLPELQHITITWLILNSTPHSHRQSLTQKSL